MLTDTVIKAAKAPRKPADCLTGVRWPLGCLKYRSAGKEKLLSLGTYPDVSLRDARARCNEARKLLANGPDRSAARQVEKRQAREAAQNDFEVLAREWLEIIKTKWSPLHYGDSLKRFETCVFPRDRPPTYR